MFVRPYLKDFLTTLFQMQFTFKNFKVVVYSEGPHFYVKSVVDLLVEKSKKRNTHKIENINHLKQSFQEFRIKSSLFFSCLFGD